MKYRLSDVIRKSTNAIARSPAGDEAISLQEVEIMPVREIATMTSKTWRLLAMSIEDSFISKEL
jgi:hypothetical protein